MLIIERHRLPAGDWTTHGRSEHIRLTHAALPGCRCQSWRTRQLKTLSVWQQPRATPPSRPHRMSARRSRMLHTMWRCALRKPFLLPLASHVASFGRHAQIQSVCCCCCSQANAEPMADKVAAPIEDTAKQAAVGTSSSGTSVRALACNGFRQQTEATNHPS